MEPVTSSLTIILLDTLKVFLLGIASAAAVWVTRKLHINKVAIPEFEKILNSSIESAINKAKKNVEDPNTIETSINLKTDIIQRSINSVKIITPKTIKKLKMKDEKIEIKVMKMLMENEKYKDILHLIKD